MKESKYCKYIMGGVAGLETHQWLWSRCDAGRSFETRRRSSKD